MSKDTVNIQPTKVFKIVSVWWLTYLKLNENDFVWIESIRKSSLGGHIATKVFTTYNIGNTKAPLKEIATNVPMNNFEPVDEW